jgi:hypothetical protein
MAESRHRHKHAHHPSSQHAGGRQEGKPTVRKAGLILAIFFGLVGLAIAFFAVGSTTAIIIGGVIGLVAGFLVGSRLDRAAQNKNL